MQSCEFGAQDAETVGGDAVGAATLFRWERLDQTLLLQTSDGAVQGSWSEAGSGELDDVFDHCVSMLWAAGQTGEDEHGRVGIVAQFRAYYVLRTTHDVVIA